MEKDLPHRTAFFSIFANLALAGVKISAGVLGNSYALIADGIESVSDVFSSFLVFLGLKYAEKPADANHPYGHGKIEPLITFIIVGLLIASALLIAYQSYQNILIPHQSPKAWTLILLGGIILWKEISFRIVLRDCKKANKLAVPLSRPMLGTIELMLLPLWLLLLGLVLRCSVEKDMRRLTTGLH